MLRRDDERLAALLADFRKATEDANSLWGLVDGGLLLGAALRDAERRRERLEEERQRIVRKAETLSALAAPGLLSKAGILRLRADPWGDGDPKDVEPIERLGWSLACDVLRFFGGRAG